MHITRLPNLVFANLNIFTYLYLVLVFYDFILVWLLLFFNYLSIMYLLSILHNIYMYSFLLTPSSWCNNNIYDTHIWYIFLWIYWKMYTVIFTRGHINTHHTCSLVGTEFFLWKGEYPSIDSVSLIFISWDIPQSFYKCGVISQICNSNNYVQFKINQVLERYSTKSVNHFNHRWSKIKSLFI